MSAQPVTDSDLLAEWAAVLDQFERDLVAVEAVLDGEIESLPAESNAGWMVPVVRGPMPEELQPRAQQIAERQHATQTAIANRMRSARGQQAVVRLLDGGPQRPVYLDVQA
ncbi:hypothetical protein ACLM5J_01620 [Nocardioides sp. Bht2]|uniref:hypothetical protein n=1 Tax=Nocardioides sp. Bht2 TaxID=3392297 RepID=UPI0039B5EE87